MKMNRAAAAAAGDEGRMDPLIIASLDELKSGGSISGGSREHRATPAAASCDVRDDISEGRF
jgi:hypothetical protein